MEIISVVRDFSMYERCINSECGKLHYFDNQINNRPIPVCYNEFLDGFNYETHQWLIFCHEDWQINQSWDFLDSLDKANIYGPIGVHYNKLTAEISTLGQITQANKDGSLPFKNGIKLKSPHIVSTIDCQCIIVHSDLIRKTGLRFDETFTFDLYAEEFCIRAKERFNISTYAVQINCTHFSNGNIGERYFRLAKELQNKFKKVKQPYFGCVPNISPLVGKETLMLSQRKILKGIFSFRISFNKKRYAINILGICFENHDSKRPCILRIKL